MDLTLPDLTWIGPFFDDEEVRMIPGEREKLSETDKRALQVMIDDP